MSITVVCECGVNHHGKVLFAVAMADAAKDAGADVVKFQTYIPEKLMRRKDPDFRMLSELALPQNDFIKLAKHCADIGIEFMTTPGEEDSLKFAVEELGVRRIKLGSDDLTNSKLQLAARATGLPIIQSTGMGTLEEIDAALSLLGIYETSYDITLLHCVSCYPTKPDQTNLNAIKTMRRHLHDRGIFDVKVGYSDHTARTIAVHAAVALGASMIEAHMMLMAGPPPADAAVSFTPMHFNTLVKGIRFVEMMLGSGVKAPNEEEAQFLKRVRKGNDGFRGLP